MPLDRSFSNCAHACYSTEQIHKNIWELAADRAGKEKENVPKQANLGSSNHRSSDRAIGIRHFLRIEVLPSLEQDIQFLVPQPGESSRAAPGSVLSLQAPVTNYVIQ